MTVDIHIDKHGSILICHGDFTVSVPFYHTLTYLRPSCYNGAPKDLVNPPYNPNAKYRLNTSSWWIVCDSAYTTPCEIRCTNDTGEMIISYHNGNTTLCTPISSKDARQLLYDVEKSVYALMNLCVVKKIPVSIFIPTGMETQFRVKPIEFTIPYGFEPVVKAKLIPSIAKVMRSSYSKQSGLQRT
jgi:hypothetical protein